MLSMVVVQEDGSPCRIGSALIRSLAYLIDSLFFGAIAYFAMQAVLRSNVMATNGRTPSSVNARMHLQALSEAGAALLWLFFSLCWSMLLLR